MPRCDSAAIASSPAVPGPQEEKGGRDSWLRPAATHPSGPEPANTPSGQSQPLTPRVDGGRLGWGGGLTEHLDVALGDGVEAAAGQQDNVGLGGFGHGVFAGLGSLAPSLLVASFLVCVSLSLNVSAEGGKLSSELPGASHVTASSLS